MSQILDDTTPVQVRSHRRAQWFWIDNAVLDTYGPTLGPIGLALYLGLCRYANSTTGKCWPSLLTLSRQCGISVISASRHLKTLVACGLIHVETRPGTTALITILDIPDSPITERGVPADPHLSEGTPPSESLDPPITEMGEPSSLNQTIEPPPNPPESARAENEEITPSPAPLHTTMDAFLAQCDPATQTQLYDNAKAALVAEGISPWQLIQPVIESRMLALWEAQANPWVAPDGTVTPPVRHKAPLSNKNFRAWLHPYYVWKYTDERIEVAEEVDGQVVRMLRERCYYCGTAAEGFDHVPPLVRLRDLLLAGAELPTDELIIVPACWPCNRRLGTRPLMTLQARLAFLQGRTP